MSLLKVNSIQNVSSIQNASGNVFAQPSTPVQTVVNRNTTAYSTSSGTFSSLFTTSITIKTTNPIIMCYLYCKHRCDIGNGNWNLGYFRVLVGGTTVMSSGYNGSQSNWIHDFTAEKPFYATGTPGTSFVFDFQTASYSGTHYFNNSAQSADDGYAIMQLTELAP
jgi:hypothetical protein